MDGTILPTTQGSRFIRRSRSWKRGSSRKGSFLRPRLLEQLDDFGVALACHSIVPLEDDARAKPDIMAPQTASAIWPVI